MTAYPKSLPEQFVAALRVRLSSSKLHRLARQDQARRLDQEGSQRRRQYPTDPVGYARNVLGVETIWAEMEAAARAVLEPPHKVMALSGHNVGKTFWLAWLLNWWFDSFEPGVVISTGPTFEVLCDTLWSEVRLQRLRAGLPGYFVGDAAPFMRTSPDHWAKAISTNRNEAFQGKHREKMLFLFDEAVGIPAQLWTIVRSMFKPEAGHAWIATCNPTDTTSQAYAEDSRGGWHRVSLSSLDHPNIAAQLAGRPAPIPSAVSVSQVREWIREYGCEAIPPGQVESAKAAVDLALPFEWPPSSGEWYRPGPEFESRCQGKWPTGDSWGLWSDALWSACAARLDPVPLDDLPEIGCDVARFGDDRTTFHVRWGNTSLEHQAVQGWATTQTAGRLIELARQYAAMANDMRRDNPRADGRRWETVRAEEIRIKVDDDGVGGGVVDVLGERGMSVQAIRSGAAPVAVGRYPNVRSELWFATSMRARAGLISLGGLDKDALATLRSQALAVRWKMDSFGRRVVEPKEITKEKLGRSPDDMDCFNLAFYGAAWDAPEVIPIIRSKLRPQGEDERGDEPQERPRRKRLFGR